MDLDPEYFVLRGLEGGPKDDGAVMGEFEGVADEILDDLADFDDVELEKGWQIGIGLEDEEVAGSLDGAGEMAGQVLEIAAKIDGCAMNGEQTVAQTGALHDVVEEASDVVRAIDSGLQEVLLFGIERGGGEQIEEAANTVERAAQVVAQHGQQFVLVPPKLRPSRGAVGERVHVTEGT